MFLQKKKKVAAMSHKITLFVMYAYFCARSSKTNTNKQSDFGSPLDSVSQTVNGEYL